MKVTGNMKNAIFSSHLSQLANTLTCGDDKVSVSRLHICNCIELNIDISETIRVLATGCPTNKFTFLKPVYIRLLISLRKSTRNEPMDILFQKHKFKML